MSKKSLAQVNKKRCIMQDEIQKIDLSVVPCKRILNYLSQVENPCAFNMEGYHVELEWMNTDITLQNRMEELFTSFS